MKKISTKWVKISIVSVSLILTIGIIIILSNPPLKRYLYNKIVIKLRGRQTVSAVLQKYESGVDRELGECFKTASITYPPEKLIFLCFKKELILEMYAKDMKNGFKYIESYPIIVPSGTLGPKLREGDRQIPEGVYQIEDLNPNSSFHLSMKLNYPNAFDKEKAKNDCRKNPGTDIFIHGENASVGCLCVGNKAIEELFVLSEKTGHPNIELLIFPYDFRNTGSVEIEKVKKENPQIPDWTQELYNDMELEYLRLKLAR